MTNSKRTATLDEVLAEYAHASQEFDPQVLQSFIDQYPAQAKALQRYAMIQLTSVPATPEEIESEVLSDEDMLPRQSRLLHRIHGLRGTSTSAASPQALDKLAELSGAKATQDAAVAVFGGSEHGEDILMMTVIESTTEIRGVPDWFYESLGSHVGVAPGALLAHMAAKRSQAGGHQRFSAKGKPIEPTPMTWEQIVEDCILDDEIKRVILNRST